MIKLSRYLFHVARNPLLAGLMLGLSLALTLSVCCFLFIDKLIFDRLLSTYDPFLMAKIAALFLALTGFSLALRFAMDVGGALLQARVSVQLKQDLLRRILGYRYHYFLSAESGSIVKRLVEDTEAAAEGVVRLFLSLSQLLQISASILAFHHLGGRLVFAYGALAGLYLFWAMVMKIPIERSSDDIGQGYGRLYDFFWEILSGIKEVKLQGMHASVGARLRALQSGFFADIRRNAMYNSLLWALVVPLSWGFFLLVMALGLEKLKSGDITTGVFMILLGMLQMTLEPLNQLMNSLGSIHRARSAVARMEALQGDHEEGPGDVRLRGFGSEIRISGLRLKYPSGRIALDGVDMRIRKGQGIAIVGGTGSGKSSLAHILLKLFQDYEGTILVDGTPLARLSTHSVREKISLLTQETILFPGTLRDNLDPERKHSDDRLREICRISQLTEVLAKLPRGIDTPVGAEGTDFSGGEKQRISLARCLSREAEIIILDEATSALDPHTEEKLILEMRNLLPAKTIVSITHKARFANWADVIYVMKDGKVAESGSHGELVARRSLYRNMFAPDHSPAVEEGAEGG